LNESDLKRALIKSLVGQGGNGFRIEDRYRLGVPDTFMLPEMMPGFLVEAKMIRTVRKPKLACTVAQAHFLDTYHRPPRFLAALIGYSTHRGTLHIGRNGDDLYTCRFVLRPSRLDSAEWPITELLWKWYHDECEKVPEAPVPEGRTRLGRFIRGVV
jgi:hypothetical protein